MSSKNGKARRGSVGSRVGVIQTQWSSLRRLTVERLDPSRRAWSGEELSAPESEARLLPVHRRDPNRPFLPRYQSTGSCCVCPQTAVLWKRRLNQSAPSVYSPAPYSGKARSIIPPSLSSIVSFCPLSPYVKKSIHQQHLLINEPFLHSSLIYSWLHQKEKHLLHCHWIHMLKGCNGTI